MDLPFFRHQSPRRDELETVPPGPADRQSVLVPVGHDSARGPRRPAAEPGRQPGPNARPGVQYLHQLPGELQPAALQRRNRTDLFHATVRHHAVPVHHSRLRHGGAGRRFPGDGRENDPDDRKLLGLPRQKHDPYPDAAVAAGRHPADPERHADDLRRQTNADDPRRNRTDDLPGPDRRDRPDQTTRHERRRLLRRQFGPSARKPERFHEYSGMLVDPDHSDGDGLRAGFLPETP